ncbi:MAG TPA: type II toxin-antitoxin system VapC family toxin [Caulobacter sp.]|nr:type II toxin-antitoxin system VapC family toxin [Caulobacter sp.]
MSRAPILLDTCAALWATAPTGLSPVAQATIAQAERDGVPVLVSAITAWELGMLVARGRIVLLEPPLKWFNGLLEAGVQLADLSPAVLVEASFLLQSRLRDPADRVIAATARSHGYRVMTRDRPLLEYAAAGHIQAIPC